VGLAVGLVLTGEGFEELIMDLFVGLFIETLVGLSAASELVERLFGLDTELGSGFCTCSGGMYKLRTFLIRDARAVEW
jgi:hypothetical protein